jgi:hypothetical protein
MVAFRQLDSTPVILLGFCHDTIAGPEAAESKKSVDDGKVACFDDAPPWIFGGQSNTFAFRGIDPG